MRKWILAAALLAVVIAAACGEAAGGTGGSPAGTPTPAQGALLGTEEARAEGTAEPAGNVPDATNAPAGGDFEAQQNAPGSADATDEAALSGELAFNVQISGATELTLSPEDGAVAVDDYTGPPGRGEQGVGQVLNEPTTGIHSLRFASADESSTLAVMFTDVVTIGTYEIGVDNVGSTVGNNVNENAAGQQSGGAAQGSTGATGQQNATPLPAPVGTVQPGGGELSPGETMPLDPLADANVQSTSPEEGIVERDEMPAPTISALFVPAGDGSISYNVLQSGTLTIDAMTENTVSGSFEFVLGSTEDPNATVTVSGTFSNVPIEGDAALTPMP